MQPIDDGSKTVQTVKKKTANFSHFKDLQIHEISSADGCLPQYFSSKKKNKKIMPTLLTF